MKISGIQCQDQNLIHTSNLTCNKIDLHHSKHVLYVVGSLQTLPLLYNYPIIIEIMVKNNATLSEDWMGFSDMFKCGNSKGLFNNYVSQN